MEISLFEILGIIQKVDLISRFLAKTDIVDFIIFAIILGMIYTKLGAGAKKIVDTVDNKINDLKTESKEVFLSFDKKIDDFKKESKERLTDNTNSIKEMGVALKRNIDSDKLELKTEISSINQRVDTLNQTVINLVANKKIK